MINDILSQYHNLAIKDPHHRFKSWEHCYNFYQENFKALNDSKVFDQGCLHLAFYLASWGMLRGGTFLLQKDYKVHKYFMKEVLLYPANNKYFNSINDIRIDVEAFNGMDYLIEATKSAYVNNLGVHHAVNVTDTLASKILLGIYGNAPAYDRYFINGAKMFGISTQFNEKSLKELAVFFNTFSTEFNDSINDFSKDGVRYTPMKVIDMFFWQIGFMSANKATFKDELEQVKSLAKEYCSSNKITINHVKTHRISNFGQTDAIRNYITKQLLIAKEHGHKFYDIRSGDIHKDLGLENRMPSVCHAMESLDMFQNVKVIHNTPSGKSSTKVIRYFLN